MPTLQLPLQEIWRGIAPAALQGCLHRADLDPTCECAPLGWLQDTWNGLENSIWSTSGEHTPSMLSFKEQLFISTGPQFGWCSLCNVYAFWRTCFSGKAKSLLVTTQILLGMSWSPINELVHWRILLAVSGHKIRRLCGHKMKTSSKTYYFHKEREWTGWPSFIARSHHLGVLHNLPRDCAFLIAQPDGQMEAQRLLTGWFRWSGKSRKNDTRQFFRSLLLGKVFWLKILLNQAGREVPILIAEFGALLSFCYRTALSHRELPLL